MTRIIAVASGKGGVGKTTLVSNLSSALARFSRSVIAVDANTTTSNLGLYLGIGWLEWAVLALTIGMVMVAEMFNTVAEAAMDAATPYYHPLVKIAKDVAAGAVLFTAIVSVLVGLLVLGPPLWVKIVELLT